MQVKKFVSDKDIVAGQGCTVVEAGDDVLKTD